MISQEKLQQLLQKPFSLTSFRKGQLDVLNSVLSNRDALAVMPTGGGKSLCYQLPALYREGLVIVISPLISLMLDQVRFLKGLQIPAGCFYSGQTLQEKREIFSQIKTSPHFILYLSPERVQKEGFANWIRAQKISLFAIDESHCVSQWGPDFREDYYRLQILRELRPEVPVLALTATATPPVLRDIIKQLGLREPDRHIHGFYRSNLYLQVEWCDNDDHKMQMVQQALKNTPEGRVLIYCGTRKITEELAFQLQAEFPETDYYHAGLDTQKRKEVQKNFEENQTRILIATNAFGMGIDIPDIRMVVHFQMPANIESYYQEIGRAGRDAKQSTCLLLYSKKDKGLHSFFIRESTGNASNIKQRWKALDTIVQFAEGGDCRNAGILTYFKDSFRMRACGHCDICDPQSERRVNLTKALKTIPKISKPIKNSAKKLDDSPLSPTEEIRMEQLKKWRKQYADEKDLPAFLIFSNKTLRDLAQKAPSTLEELEKVYGFGPQKTEHLGKLVLEQIALCS